MKNRQFVLVGLGAALTASEAAAQEIAPYPGWESPTTTSWDYLESCGSNTCNTVPPGLKSIVEAASAKADEIFAFATVNAVHNTHVANGNFNFVLSDVYFDSNGNPVSLPTGGCWTQTNISGGLSFGEIACHTSVADLAANAPDVAKCLMLHEFMHSHGVGGHTAQGDGLMSPDCNENWSPFDITQYERDMFVEDWSLYML
jgi:hypothetical protein